MSFVTLSDIPNLTDHQLRDALKSLGQSPGPITETTRSLYRNKLASLIESESQSKESSSEEEDELVLDEDEEITDDDDDEVDTLIEESDEEIDEDEEYDVESHKTPKDLKRSSSWKTWIISLSFISVAILAISYSGDPKSLKTLAISTILILLVSPILYGLHKLYVFYRRRKDDRTQKVCDLVADALELLQSPENPKKMMPVLHIRDTLITPAERNSKKILNLWKECVKFIEEQESRVKVEIVNIDGEDFRAWKWIGSRK